MRCNVLIDFLINSRGRRRVLIRFFIAVVFRVIFVSQALIFQTATIQPRYNISNTFFGHWSGKAYIISAAIQETQKRSVANWLKCRVAQECQENVRLTKITPTTVQVSKVRLTLLTYHECLWRVFSRHFSKHFMRHGSTTVEGSHQSINQSSQASHVTV